MVDVTEAAKRRTPSSIEAVVSRTLSRALFRIALSH